MRDGQGGEQTPSLAYIARPFHLMHRIPPRAAMPRRPLRHPDHLARRDREDVAVCNAIIVLLQKLHSRGYLSDVPVNGVARWLRGR
jgi:hypothetical protein